MLWYLVYVISWNKKVLTCELEIKRVVDISNVKWHERKNHPQILVHLI